MHRRDDGGFLGQPAWLWSAAALLLGLALSLVAATLHLRSLERDQQVRVERLAEQSFDAVDDALQNCGLLVRSVQALFLSSDEVSAAEFESMYANLRPRELFPSLQAMAYARREPPAAGDADGPVAYTTVLVAPRSGNAELIGLDIAAQPANLAAARYARDADRPVMSAAFELVQRRGLAGERDGITIRLPVFSPGELPRDLAERRRREMGSLAVSFRVSRLIQDALPRQTLQDFRVRVVDITDAEPRPLFANLPDAGDGDGQPRYTQDVAYGGRTWRIELQQRQAGAGLFGLPLLTFGIGALASALLAGLAWSLARTRSRAIAMARELADQYRQSESRFRALNELLPALVMLARSADGRLVYANQASRDRLGLDDLGLSSARLVDFVNDLPVREAVEALAADPAQPALHNEPARIGIPGQPEFWSTLSVCRIDLGEESHLLAVANDITELRVLSEELTYQAAHDSLTGLLNRREFERRLDAAIAVLDRGGPPCALLYLDLDQFKLVNDTSGHFAGDQLLAQLAPLMSAVLPPAAVLARLGGDEFGVLLPGAGPAEATALAERLRLEVDGYVFGWEQRHYTISTSIGVVPLDQPGLSQRSVMSQADTACYMAKERGRNRVHVYSADDTETSRRRSEMEWATRIRHALSEHRFLLHYQELAPLWDGDHGAGVHMELLVRLRDESGAMVSPGAFIPAAERYGLMPVLDRWVVETALANFHRLHPGGKPIELCAINLSGPTFEDDSFADFVLEKLVEYGVDPVRICFEITETAAVSNMVRAIAFMQRLRTAGCKFSLDDFGAGMASFAYLKNLPVDYIKIDGSFIRNIESDPVSYSIVRAVTDIGHQLKLKVVAEWVADERAREILRGLTVDYAQGFAIHKPEATLCFREGKPG